MSPQTVPRSSRHTENKKMRFSSPRRIVSPEIRYLGVVDGRSKFFSNALFRISIILNDSRFTA